MCLIRTLLRHFGMSIKVNLEGDLMLNAGEVSLQAAQRLYQYIRTLHCAKQGAQLDNLPNEQFDLHLPIEQCVTKQHIPTLLSLNEKKPDEITDDFLSKYR